MRVNRMDERSSLLHPDEDARRSGRRKQRVLRGWLAFLLLLLLFVGGFACVLVVLHRVERSRTVPGTMRPLILRNEV